MERKGEWEKTQITQEARLLGRWAIAARMIGKQRHRHRRVVVYRWMCVRLPLISAVQSIAVAGGSAEDPDGWTEIVLDSGAFTHVCPRTFAETASKTWSVSGSRPAVGTAARTADGTALPLLGYRKVLFELEDGKHLDIEFAMYAIARPIFSVSALVAQGAVVRFGPQNTAQ